MDEEETNIIAFDPLFRKLEAEEPFENAVFTYSGIDYLVEVTGYNEKTKEIEILICGFLKGPQPTPLPNKKLDLLPIGADVSLTQVTTTSLHPISKPRIVLDLPEYAAYNYMLFTKANQLDEAEKWKPHLSTEMPMVFSNGTKPA